jgi:dihydrofolate synthase/folylpolyglutamate synthase
VTFEAAVAYLLETINETVSRRMPNRLDRMRALLAALGDPHLAYPTIHVGGTSGKGSTSTMIAAALTASGKRVGLHAKPHLASVTERARVDDVPVAEATFAALLTEMLPTLDAVACDHGRPTYYETLLAIAFVYFRRSQVDVAVIEVGIGGTLDGTNLVQPLVAAITSVGLDHTDVLGETLVEIARDKAGIAKPGVPLVTDTADAGAFAEIAAACARVGAPLVVVRDVARIAQRPAGSYAQAFDVTTTTATYHVDLPLLGAFQQRNAATAIVVLEQLPQALRPSAADVVRGLARTVVAGRMEYLPGSPSIVFDIAHNADKAAGLAQGLAHTFPGKRFAFVIAIGESKDAESVLAPLLALPGTFTFTSFDATGKHAVPPERLLQLARARGVDGTVVADSRAAFAAACGAARADDIVVVTGSTYVVARLRADVVANAPAASARS